MSEKKRRLCLYQPNDTDAIAACCEKMARKGWLLEKLGGLMIFRRIEPAELTFAVTFFPDASVYDPQPTEPQETYADYCRAAGWELAAVQGSMQVFYTRAEHPTPIETDEAHKFEAIRKSMRKTTVLSYALLMVSMALNFSTQLGRLNREPLEVLSSNSLLLLLLVSGTLLVLFTWLLLDYGLWCLRSKRSLERGGGCARPFTRAHYVATCTVLTLAALMLAALVEDILTKKSGALSGLVLAGMAVMYGAIYLSWRLLKRYGKSRNTVRWGYLAAVIVLVLLFEGVLVALAVRGNFSGKPVETYANRWGTEWDIYHDNLPLTLEALGYPVAAEDHCSYEAEENRSLLADCKSYSQTPYGDGSTLPQLTCTVAHISSDALRDFCWKKLVVPAEMQYRLNNHIFAEPEAIDPAVWGAEAAFYREWAGGKFFLRYDNRIVTLSLGQVPTGAVLEKLAAFAAST